MSAPFSVGYGNASLGSPSFDLPKFKSDYMIEYIRQNKFNKYMGRGATMPIQVEVELKKGGESITFPMMGRLKKRGVAQNMPLAGREEALSRYKHQLTVEYYRNAVLLTERDEHMVFAKALPQVRPHLMRWSKEQLRDDIIDAFGMVLPNVTLTVPLVNPDPTQVLIGDPSPVVIKRQATTGEANTWLTNNADRVIFGGVPGNLSAGNFATSIGNVTSGTNDRFGSKVLDRMKMAAELADPHMTPIEVGADQEEYWIVFCDAYSFASAQYDTNIMAFMRESRAREGKGWSQNPMRTGADLEWNGMIIRKIPELAPWSATVGRAYLCGAQAICVGIGMDADFRERKDDDYGHLKGVGITECKGVNKFQRFDGTAYVDNAVVSAFTYIGA